MKWSVARSTIADAIRDTSSDLAAKDDVLAGQVLLRLRGSVLTVVGRDLYTTVSTNVAVGGTEDGATCVDHRRLNEFLHRVTSEDVRFSVTSTRLKVRAGVGSLELPIQGADAFVVPPFSRTRSISVSADALSRCLRRVASAAHDDSAHPTLWGVHVESTGHTLVAEASDTKRFARAEARAAAEPFSVTLNRRFATKLLALLRDAAMVSLSEDGARICVEAGRMKMVGPLPHSAFPRVNEAMTPASSSKCEIDVRELREAVEALRVVSDEAAVCIAMSTGRLHLSVRSEDGEASFPIRCRMVGTGAEVSVGLRDFRAACSAIDVDAATVGIGDGPQRLVQVEALDDGGGGVRWVLATRAAGAT